jgi:hypothetical protein
MAGNLRNAGSISNLQLALILARMDFKVFPCNPKTKGPLTPRGYYDATTDEGQIHTWWQQHPTALVGIPTAGFWVLDIDLPEKSAPELCSRLRWEWRDLTAKCGLIVRTPRRGFHFYFKRTPCAAVRTAASDITANIDSRGHDAEGQATGYIIAPGNVLPDGRRYEIEHGDFAGLCEAPTQLLYLVAFSRREQARIANDRVLMDLLRSAEPSAWRHIFEEHEAARRPERIPVTITDTAPMRRQALHDLEAQAHRLADLRDGRRTAIFNAAARLARYASNGIVSPAEIEAGLLDAWRASGAHRRHGLGYPRGAIRRALDRGRNDPLPPLARRFRNEQHGGAA